MEVDDLRSVVDHRTLVLTERVIRIAERTIASSYFLTIIICFPPLQNQSFQKSNLFRPRTLPMQEIIYCVIHRIGFLIIANLTGMMKISNSDRQSSKFPSIDFAVRFASKCPIAPLCATVRWSTTDRRSSHSVNFDRTNDSTNGCNKPMVYDRP